MTRLIFLFVLLVTLFACIQTSGQTKKSEKDFSKYFKLLQSTKVDTIIIIKSGCTGCEVSYRYTSKSINDGQTIYVLIRNKGALKLAIFDDIHKPKYLTLDTCLVFNYVDSNKSLLGSKEQFYKKELTELKKSKFLPPGPIHYSYADLTIQLKSFKYNFIVVADDSDYLGFIRKNEMWFQATKKIIDKFFACIKSSDN